MQNKACFCARKNSPCLLRTTSLSPWSSWSSCSRGFFNKQMTQILVLHHRVAIKRHSPISFQFCSYASLDGGAVVVPALFPCPFLPLFFATSSAIAIQIVTEQVSKNTLWHLYGQPIQAKTSPGSQLNLCPGGDLVGISSA